MKRSPKNSTMLSWPLYRKLKKTFRSSLKLSKKIRNSDNTLGILADYGREELAKRPRYT